MCVSYFNSSPDRFIYHINDSWSSATGFHDMRPKWPTLGNAFRTTSEYNETLTDCRCCASDSKFRVGNGSLTAETKCEKPLRSSVSHEATYHDVSDSWWHKLVTHDHRPDPTKLVTPKDADLRGQSWRAAAPLFLPMILPGSRQSRWRHLYRLLWLVISMYASQLLWIRHTRLQGPGWPQAGLLDPDPPSAQTPH
jgi:hypothetical protein